MVVILVEMAVFEIRRSCAEAFLQQDSVWKMRRSMASMSGLLGRDVLCCLTITGARLYKTVRVGGVCGCTPIFPEGVGLRPDECNKLARPSFA
jgi:hypothetical protein